MLLDIRKFETHPQEDNVPPILAGLQVTAFNSCTGEYPYWISGGEILSGDELSVSEQLNSARFNASLEVIDSVTLMPVTLDFDLVWTGTGGLSTYNNGFVDRIEGRQLSLHENGSYRNGEATGTVTMESQNVLPAEFDYALMGQFRSTAHDVIH